MNKLLFLIAFLTVYSCSRVIERKLELTLEKDLSTECNGVVDLVNKNWGKDKKLNYYHSKNGFTDILQKDFQNCVLSMNRDDVINLLGSPTDSDHSYLVFYLNEECFRMTTEATCIGLEFTIDSNSKNVIHFSARPQAIFVH